MSSKSKNKPSRQNQPNTLVYAQKQISHSGPLPAPETLREYDDLIPGTAERIIEAFTKQVDHRIDVEKKAVSHGMWIEKAGQIFAFILALVTLGGSFWLITSGFSGAGIAGIITAVAGLIGIFIYHNKTS